MLPKIDVPIYNVKLLSDGKDVKFRPFTVKEEKLFLMTNETDDVKAILETTKQVLNNCILKVKDFFNIDKWSFSQPINLSQLELEIARVEGVQSLTNVEIVNLTSKDGNYSPHEYDILSATKNKIIYPSLDPCVFEVKYTDIDIKGNVV